MKITIEYYKLILIYNINMCVIPIRCFTCGKVIGNKWEEYQNMISEKKSPGEALNKIGLKRICCRRMILSHVDLIDKMLKYSIENKYVKNYDSSL